MTEEANTAPVANTAPERPKTAADAYAKFIDTQDEYHSIFQSTDSGSTAEELGITTGKISKRE